MSSGIETDPVVLLNSPGGGQVELHGFHPSAIARLKRYKEKGHMNYEGLSLNEFGHLAYLADSLGIRKVVADIQNALDRYKTDDQRNLVRIVNAAAICPSLSIDSPLERIDLVNLIKRDQLKEIHNANALSQLFKIQLWLDVEIERNWEKREEFECQLMKNVFEWAVRNKVGQASFYIVLESLPVRDEFWRSIDSLEAVTSFDCYYELVCMEKVFSTWMAWLERKSKERGRAKESVSKVIPREIGSEKDVVLEVIQNGIQERKRLPDSLFINAMLRPSPAIQRIQENREHRIIPDAEESSGTNTAIVPVARNQNAVVLRKRDILKEAIKVPFIKLKAKLLRRRNN